MGHVGGLRGKRLVCTALTGRCQQGSIRNAAINRDGAASLKSSPSLSRGGGPPGDSRVVVGKPRDRVLHDALGDSRSILQHLSRRNTNGLQTLRPQKRIPRLIARGPVPDIVRFAIDLDHQPRIRAVEIELEFAARMLASELHALRLPAQITPQQHFRQAHVLAVFPRPNNGSRGGLWRNVFKHNHPLHHPLRGRSPSPRQARGGLLWVAPSPPKSSPSLPGGGGSRASD